MIKAKKGPRDGLNTLKRIKGPQKGLMQNDPKNLNEHKKPPNFLYKRIGDSEHPMKRGRENRESY